MQQTNHILSLTSPLPHPPVEGSELDRAYQPHRFTTVPRYGIDERVSMWWVNLIRTLTENSPTYSKTTRRINDFAFGHVASIGPRGAAGLKDSEVSAELPRATQVSVAAQLRGMGISLPVLLDTCKQIQAQLNRDNNALLVIQVATVEGASWVRLSVPDAQCWGYWRNDELPEGERVVLVSKFLTKETELQKHEPAAYRVTGMGRPFRWTQDGDVLSAAVHIVRGKVDDGTLYARTDRVPDLNNLATDYLLTDKFAKDASTDLVARTILAFQRPERKFEKIDPNTEEPVDEFTQFVSQLRELTTRQGNKPSSMVALEYAAGANPPVNIPLDVNRDTDYQTFSRKSVQADICGALGWSPVLNFSEQAATNLGGNLLYDLFEVIGMTTVESIQCFYEELTGQLFEELAAVGVQGAQGYQLKFANLVTDFVERVRGNRTESQPNAARTPQGRNDLTDLTEEL